MSAFKQVVGKLQKGNREEAVIGLEFVLRLDPAYAPAKNLHEQMVAGATEIDLGEIFMELHAPTTEVINTMVIEAVEDFNNREFEAAKAKVEQVLLDLPGHEEARDLLRQIEESTKDEKQVSLFLSQARAELAKGNPQEAANFVMMAQALDPHHHDIAATINEIESSGAVSMTQAGFSPVETTEDDALFDVGDEEGMPVFGAAAEASELFVDPAPQNIQEAVGERERLRAETAAMPELSIDETLPESDSYYEEPEDDVADLFDAGPTTFDEQPVDDEIDPSDPAAVIRDLLSKGGAAAAEDNYVSAIDTWSRILLLDHAHGEARDRIEHIRHAKEALDQRIEPMLADAEAAFESGDETLARDFVDRALSLSPGHVPATILQEKISRGAALGDGSEMPDLEDDLFTDAFSATTDFEPAARKDPRAPEGEWRAAEKTKRRMPWQGWTLLGIVGVLIVVGALWLADVFVPEDQGPPRIEVVTRILAEADELFNRKQVQEAILYLEQNSADDDFQVRIDRRLDKYRSAIATPVPTAIPEGLVASRALVAEGRWFAAYQRVLSELVAHPGDPGLEAVRAQILEVEPGAAALLAAVDNRNHPAAISIAKDLMEKHPNDRDLPTLYHRCLFNAGVAELRAINLTTAETFLLEFDAQQPNDTEVQRILAIISTYRGRPVDMQLEIFVRSIVDR